jgi:glycosyltransferase involved in cell wall biosynthesis
MNISVVIPLYNEDESLPELTSWIDKVMVAHNYTYEVLLIDDGSKDKSWAVIEDLRAANKNIKGIKFQRNYGKSAALYVGFEAAQGDVVITMDADLQDSPEEIPGLYSMIVDEGYDLISGWKKKRYDPLSKTIPTKLFNWAARKVSGVYLHDFNCGLKSYRKDVIKSIELYGEMHRYIPILSKRAGFDKIGERVVEHQARKYGTTKFGLDRFINGFLDLLSITFVSKFGQRPMHFFGLQGTIMFLIGFFMAMYLLVNKAIQVSLGNTEPLVANSPFFYIGLVTMVIGSQLFLAGFLGELISRKSSERNNYLIEKKIL